jgi:hypothetical protein
MNAKALVWQLRDHYVDQFRSFVALQRRQYPKGASEVKFRVPEEAGFFGQMCCVDFIRNDGATIPVEFMPDRVLTFAPTSGTLANASFAVGRFTWDDVVIRHDLDHLPSDRLSKWFRLRFDPDDVRRNPLSELSEVIHSVRVQPHQISIDFGTAKPDAFWDLLQLIVDAGAVRVEISCSRSDAPDEDRPD